MLERALSGLYGASLIAVLALAGVSLALGREFDLLSRDFPMAARWLVVACWLGGAVVLAWLGAPLRQWRWVLHFLAAACVALPVLRLGAAWRAGARVTDALSLGFATSCVLLAVAGLLLASRLRPAGAAPERTRRNAPRHARVKRIHVAVRFGVAAVAVVAAFAEASGLPASSAQSGAAALGLLAGFCLTLPAASIAIWYPRSAALMHLLAAGTFAWIGWLWLGLSSALLAALDSRIRVSPLSNPTREAA